jgi:hypothetical protein
MSAASLRVDAFQRVPRPLWAVVVVLAAIAPLSANPWPTAAAALLLAWLFALLLRPGETPILLLAGGFQWLQVCAKLLKANALGIPLEELGQQGSDLQQATWLGLASVAVLVGGMRLALGPYRPQEAQRNRLQGLEYSPRRVAKVYAWAVALSLVVGFAAYLVPGLTQLALALAGAKWAAYFILAYVCFLKTSRIGLLVAAFVVEFALGFGGYFADFRLVFFVTLLALVSAGLKLTFKRSVVIGGIGLLLLAISLAWTAVKIEYRAYLNDGTRSQVIVRSYDERVEKLVELLTALRAEDFERAVDDLVERIAYVDFFGGALAWVPEMVEHTEGEIWTGAVLHVLTPRLLFPDKPPLPNDSENTALYTGMWVSGDESGTSVSLGYAAESYIDFGVPLMFLPILALGWLWGKLFRIIGFARSGSFIFNQGLALSVLLGAVHFESNIVKLIGGVLTAFAVAWVIQRFFSRSMMRLLTEPRSSVHPLAGAGLK